MEYLKKSIERSTQESRALTENVAEIIRNVRENGDSAILEYNTRFDGNTRQNFRVSPEEIKAAYDAVPPQSLHDMREAAAHIKAFALAQKECLKPLDNFSTIPGAVLGHRIIPVTSCCCYVPGGGYPLYSSALMLIIPAKTAGVGRVTACAPAVKETGCINPLTLAAMDIAGADEIYVMGGAHSIAAFSYGTRQISPVDIIVGPGNQYVAEAKRQCYGQIGIDFIAGPSEVLVIADKSANPTILAADLLAQSEHDKLAKGILVTTDRELGLEVIRAVEAELETLETARIARASWESYGEVVLADNITEAVALANEYAPEHLEVILENPDAVLDQLHNFGSLFIGQETGEVFGDYASGTNHTLPTVRASRYTGGVWVGTFLKTCTYQRYDRAAMKETAPLVSRMARGEGLIGHARAAEVRKELLD